MKRHTNKSLKVFASTMLAFSILPATVWAAETEMVSIGDGLTGSFRLILILLFVVLVLCVLGAFWVSHKINVLKGITQSVATFTGRDASAGGREFWAIFGMGSLMIMGAFLVGFNPFLPENLPPPPPVAEVEDWTEPAEAAIIFMTDAEAIESGKTTFTKKCAACHGPSGEGLIGPNLLDEYWKNGGSAMDIFTSITNGIDKTSMVAWKERITPKKRLEILSYLNSMQGKIEGKEPEGEKYSPDGAPNEDSEAIPAN